MKQEQWDELKRLHIDSQESPSAGVRTKFGNAMFAAFPAILAEREAAQRLRDALDGQADGIADAIDAFDAVVTK